MNDCLFCKIVDKEIPSKKIYENKDIVAFLDINPISFGHTLVVPKKHIKDFIVLSDEENNKIKKELLKVVDLLNEKLSCTGISIITNIGSAQDVKHLHYHLIPKYKKPLKPNIDKAYELLK